MEDAIVEGTGVSKVYTTGKVSVKALQDINLKIYKGEIVVIMGPSGCGKTTLLNCFSGLDIPTAGRVLVEGKDIYRMSDRQRSYHRAKRMGFVFQAFNLLPVLTAVENVEIPLLVAGVNMRLARKKALSTLSSVGLESRAFYKPMELSGGEQQRVAIARALVNDPAIIWADEPTGNLDSESSKKVIDLISKINRERRATFVIVTHDKGVAQIGNRVIHMRDGRLMGLSGDRVD